MSHKYTSRYSHNRESAIDILSAETSISVKSDNIHNIIDNTDGFVSVDRHTLAKNTQVLTFDKNILLNTTNTLNPWLTLNMSEISNYINISEIAMMYGYGFGEFGFVNHIFELKTYEETIVRIQMNSVGAMENGYIGAINGGINGHNAICDYNNTPEKKIPQPNDPGWWGAYIWEDFFDDDSDSTDESINPPSSLPQGSWEVPDPYETDTSNANTPPEADCPFLDFKIRFDAQKLINRKLNLINN